MTRPEITSLFNAFAGRDVQVLEAGIPVLTGDSVYTPDFSCVVKSDPIVLAMQKTASESGYSISFELPGECGITDYDETRIKVSVDKGLDGKWRVQNNFRIG